MFIYGVHIRYYACNLDVCVVYLHTHCALSLWSSTYSANAAIVQWRRKKRLAMIMMIVVVVDDVGGDDGDDLDLAPHHISTPKLCENCVYYIFYLHRDVRTFAAQLRIRTARQCIWNGEPFVRTLASLAREATSKCICICENVATNLPIYIVLYTSHRYTKCVHLASVCQWITTWLVDIRTY